MRKLKNIWERNMNYNDMFLKDKTKILDKSIPIVTNLHNKVMQYQNDRPILCGKKTKYIEILNNYSFKEDPQEIDNITDSLSKMFQRCVVWEHPGTMINITPPANLNSVALSSYVNYYNPNFAQDEPSGYLVLAEMIVSKYLAELAGYDWKKAKGIFSFGGKGTILYAVKSSLNKVIDDVSKKGVSNHSIKIISNEKGHPCHIEVCDWLGLGRDACDRLPVDKDGRLDLERFECYLRSCFEEKVIVPCIIINGGTTNEVIVDDIKKVANIRDKLVREYKLDYTPHLHVDSVIGWAWLVFKDYDFKKNHLKMSKIELKKIKEQLNRISNIKYADSFGADFHKTGFCPYVSSVYMCKNSDELYAIGNKKTIPIEDIEFGEYSPFEHTLELSRSATGAVSAFVALETFGKKGFQELIYKLFSSGEKIRSYINSYCDFEVINNDTLGFASLFVIHKTNSTKRYNDYLTTSDSEVLDFLEYNHQFYLYTLKLFEEGKIAFKITFSKSYKPYGFTKPTGALKIYNTSPIATEEEYRDIIKKIHDVKIDFDKINSNLTDLKYAPVDFVYR